MNANEGYGTSMRTLGILLVLSFLCGLALVPPVAADKWLTDNRVVLANCSEYATIGGNLYYDDTFFAVTGNGHYNNTQVAWNWTTDSQYSDRRYMEQITVANSSGDHWYPDPYVGGVWQWEFVNSLDSDATIYKRGLAAYVNHNPAGITPYYAWYGNKTAATGPGHNKPNWLYPTYENATYVVNLTVDWDDEVGSGQCPTI